jgi:tetratricopeptide (TPR) repeat protein
LHKAGSSLRAKLGESLGSVEKYDKPLSEATTSSLDALKALSMGDAKHNMAEELAAVPNYQRAIELDPNFAMAYARLGAVYNNLGQSELSEQNRKRAFELRDRASEREKLYITSHYYGDSGQLNKGIAALELFKQTYPRDFIPYNNLAVLYNQLGQFEYALDNARQAVALDSDSVAGASNLAQAYLGLNRLDEAQATINDGLKRGPRDAGLHAMLAGIAWTQNNPSGMEKEIELVRSSGQEGEFIVARMRVSLAEGGGQLKQARTLNAKAEAAARQANLTEAAASSHAQLAAWEAIYGFRAQAIESANQALRDSQSPNVTTSVAFVLALTGEADRALKLINDLAAQRPYDTLLHFVDVPSVSALIALNRKEPAKAIDLLDGVMVYARVNTGVLYTRGQAYLQAKQGKEAADAFQKMIDARAVNSMDPFSSLAQLGLARAYAMQGDLARSRVSYQNFLALWKDADPDVPLLIEAKAEYAKVQQ